MKMLLFFLALISNTFLFAQKLVVPYRLKDGKWCLVNKSTKVKVTEPVDKIDYIEQGVYQFKQNGFVGLYDTIGKLLLPAKYKPVPTIVEYKDKMYALKEDAIVKYFDTKGKLAFVCDKENPPLAYTYFENGFLETKKGLINKKGKLVIKHYDLTLINYQDNNLIQVGNKISIDKTLWGVINMNGKAIVPIKYNWLEIEKDYILAGKNFDDVEIVYDLKGKTLLKGKFREIKIFRKIGLYSCIKDYSDYTFALKDLVTKKEISDKYSDFDELSNGNVIVEKFITSEKEMPFAIIGKGGKIVRKLKPVYSNLYELDIPKGYLYYEDTLDKMGVIDFNEKVVLTLPDSTNYALNKKLGIELYNKKTKNVGYINYKGDFIETPEYIFVKYIKDLKLWLVCPKNNKCFYINSKGEKYLEVE